MGSGITGQVHQLGSSVVPWDHGTRYNCLLPMDATFLPKCPIAAISRFASMTFTKAILTVATIVLKAALIIVDSLHSMVSAASIFLGILERNYGLLPC